MDLTYVCDYLWGLCVIVSWAGWGGLLRSALRITDRRSADWGIRAGWGASVTIAIGGVLNLCHISYQPVVIALVVTGLLCELAGLILRFRRWLPRYRRWRASPKVVKHTLVKTRRRLIPALLFIGPCILALAFLYTGSVHQPYCLNPYDDYLAYMVFPIRMLQTGTLIEPFSQRRLATFGGHAFLCAQVFSGSSTDMVWALEMGICPIVIGALIYGFLRPRNTRQLLFAGLLIVLSFMTAVPRANSQSLATGVMLFLSLFRTLALEKGMPAQRKRIGWVTVIIVAAVSTLRVNDLIAGFGTLILWRISVTTDRSAFERLKDAALDSFKACLFLIPWSLLLFLSSRTFLWPLMKGNERGFHLLLRMDASPVAYLRWVGQFLSWGPIPWLLTPLLLPILFPPFRRCRSSRAALCAAGAGFATTIITVAGNSPTINFIKDLYRFTFPIMFSMSLAILVTAMTARYFAKRLVPNIVAFVAIGAYIYWLGDPRFLWELNVVGMKTPAPSAAIFSYQQADYRDLQYSIPKGASLFTILNYPNLLDYRRNQIFNADMLLPYGPYPGLPFFEGPDGLKRYLKSQHIDYVAAVDFDQDQTSWYSRPNDANRVIYSNPVFYLYKPYFFDCMHNIDLLDSREQVLFRRDGIRLFRLGG